MFPALRFINPVYLAGMRDGRHVLVAEVGGQIQVFDTRARTPRPRVVLDLSKRILQRNFVEGLLGFSFHPRWPERREVFVYYSTHDPGASQANQATNQAKKKPGRAVLSRFVWPREAPGIDPTSERVLVSIENHHTVHHGGSIEFAPDGTLYLGVGDLGPQHDTDDHAQNLGSLRGKILRVDIEATDSGKPYRIPPDNPFIKTPGARPEIFALGLRNPYRMAFDPVTGALFAADVGQVHEEEVDLVVAGGNYGWNVLEGLHVHDPKKKPPPTAIAPIARYGRDVGGSITGGYVYRGRGIPALYGAYIYGDWVSSRVFWLRVEDGRVVASGEMGRVANPNAFGLGDDGELYALSMDGRVHKMVPAAGPQVIAKRPVARRSESALLSIARSRAAVARGGRLYARGCNVCHGPAGEGAIGPNLRDDHWLHGSRMTDIVTSIETGNVQAGMPPWHEIYAARDIEALAAFVANLALPAAVAGEGPQGKEPQGKEPQGKFDPIRYLAGRSVSGPEAAAR
jgi:glucose/arabinose dehydrogenase/cytochrome c553